MLLITWLVLRIIDIVIEQLSYNCNMLMTNEDLNLGDISQGFVVVVAAISLRAYFLYLGDIPQGFGVVEVVVS